MKTIQDFNFSNKKAIIRVDFNVPLDEKFAVTDATRIEAAKPTIDKILQDGGSVILMSHLGRPDGVRKPEFSMKPIVPALEDLVKRKVQFLNDCVGGDVERACSSASNGQILLLENLRFHLSEEGKGLNAAGEKIKAEKKEVENFRKSLTSLGDLYINDAFGTAHRAHSSMVGVNVPVRAAGFLMKKELQYFSKVLENPVRPMTVVMGGAKVKDKIQLIMNLLDIVDEMIIGGGMAFTFNKVMNGTKIGASLYDVDGAALVPEILAKAAAKNVKIHIPTDFLCADKFAADANVV